MIGKLLKFGAPAVIGALAALSFPDAKRYVAIRRISSGGANFSSCDSV